MNKHSIYVVIQVMRPGCVPPWETFSFDKVESCYVSNDMYCVSSAVEDGKIIVHKFPMRLIEKVDEVWSPIAPVKP